MDRSISSEEDSFLRLEHHHVAALKGETQSCTKPELAKGDHVRFRIIAQAARSGVVIAALQQDRVAAADFPTPLCFDRPPGVFPGASGINRRTERFRTNSAASTTPIPSIWIMSSRLNRHATKTSTIRSAMVHPRSGVRGFDAGPRVGRRRAFDGTRGAHEGRALG